MSPRVAYACVEYGFFSSHSFVIVVVVILCRRLSYSLAEFGCNLVRLKFM